MKNISRRKWLNSNKELSAFIITYVGVNNYGISGDVSISDCSRKVSLDFFSLDSREFKKSIKKIDTLLTELSIFKANLLKARKHLETIKTKKGKKNDKD